MIDGTSKHRIHATMPKWSSDFFRAGREIIDPCAKNFADILNAYLNHHYSFSKRITVVLPSLPVTSMPSSSPSREK